MRKIQVSPSLLASDFARLGEQVQAVGMALEARTAPGQQQQRAVAAQLRMQCGDFGACCRIRQRRAREIRRVNAALPTAREWRTR